MTTSDLVVSNNKGIASVKISVFLSEEDYAAHWAGDNGTDGYATENVEKIKKIFSNYSIGKFGIDLQIWEEGNAYIDNIDFNKIEDLKKDLEEAFSISLEIAERN